MIDVFTNEYHFKINAYGHRDSVQKAISIFKANKNTVNSNNNKDKDKKELDDDLNKFHNNIHKHCNNSKACNR